MNAIDAILNRITMYRVVLYYLGALIAVAVGLAFFGILPYSPAAILFSAGLFIAACSIIDRIGARLFSSEPGADSAVITGLILVLIVNPVMPTDLAGIGIILAISTWAIASKYIIAWHKKQVFNPAAFGVVVSALIFSQGATWWVGNLYLAPFVIAGGLLIVRKIERFDVVIAFAVAALATIAFTSLPDSLSALWNTLAHSSFLFLALVMLTEPSTLPPSRSLRILYGILAGVLFAPAVHILSYYFTPETALLAANLFSFIVSPKGKHVLTLASRTQLADGTYEFVFTPERRFAFTAGQYLEWTLPGANNDSRGNRRYFTIASAPEEATVRLGVKFYQPMSTFKQELLALKKGDTISAGQLAGDFTLPRDENKKLAFIAGGIGITPFRSMVGNMAATGKARDTVLLYGANTERDIAYKDFFDSARERLGLKVVYAAADKATLPNVVKGRIDERMITSQVPDYADRTFYISGPRGMVTSFTDALRALGLPSSQIKTDYFPGFA